MIENSRAKEKDTESWTLHLSQQNVSDEGIRYAQSALVGVAWSPCRQLSRTEPFCQSGKPPWQLGIW
jgi:hypothetical protein